MVPTASPGANQDDEDDAVVVVVVEAAVRIAVNRAVVVVGTPTVRLAAPTTAERRRIEEDVNMLCVCVCVCTCVCVRVCVVFMVRTNGMREGCVLLSTL